MSEENQYQTPSSNVEQTSTAEYGQVKLFAVSGRICRIRYIAYNFGILLVFFVVIMISSVATGLSVSEGSDMGILGIIMTLITVAATIVYYVILFMLTIQRSHDFNASGWLCLISLVPLASLIFLFIPGTDGENQYGLKTPPNGAATAVVVILFLLIPITGIIAAIAIPAYQGYIDQARQMQMEQSNNIQQ